MVLSLLPKKEKDELLGLTGGVVKGEGHLPLLLPLSAEVLSANDDRGAVGMVVVCAPGRPYPLGGSNCTIMQMLPVFEPVCYEGKKVRTKQRPAAAARHGTKGRLSARGAWVGGAWVGAMHTTRAQGAQNISKCGHGTNSRRSPLDQIRRRSMWPVGALAEGLEACPKTMSLLKRCIVE